MFPSRGAKQSGQSGFVSPEHWVGVNLDNFLTVGTEPRRCPSHAEGPRPGLGGARWFGDRVMETVLVQGSTGVSFTLAGGVWAVLPLEVTGRLWVLTP